MPHAASEILAFPGRAPRRGVTLIELLVVMGIISVLVGILVPAVALVRRSSKLATCSANLRQWAIAARTYAMDYDGYIPRRGQGTSPTTQLDNYDDWFNALPPLMGKEPYSVLAAGHGVPHAGDGGIWICPEAREVQYDIVFTYAMNMWLSTRLNSGSGSAVPPDRINNVGDPTTMVFMADGPDVYCSVALPRHSPVPAYNPAPRHGGAVNIAFLDGHVAAFAGDAIGCGSIDPMRADVRWVVPNSPWKGPDGP